MGVFSWVTDTFVTNLGNNLGGIELASCENVFFAYKPIEKTFLNKKLAKAIYTALGSYKKSLDLYPNEMHSYVKDSKKYIEKITALLKKYDKELEVFKSISSGFKKLVKTKDNLKIILAQLKIYTLELKEKKYTFGALVESSSKASRTTLTKYLIGDFANDFIEVINHSLEDLDNVVNLSEEVKIDYKVLDIRDVKISKKFSIVNGELNTKDTQRNEKLEKTVSNHYKDEAQKALKLAKKDVSAAENILKKVQKYNESLKKLVEKQKLKNPDLVISNSGDVFDEILENFSTDYVDKISENKKSMDGLLGKMAGYIKDKKYGTAIETQKTIAKNLTEVKAQDKLAANEYKAKQVLIKDIVSQSKS